MSKDWMSVRIPSELAEEIRAEAKDRGTTITKVVEERLAGSERDDYSPVDGRLVTTNKPLHPVKVIEVTDGVCQHLNKLEANTGIICLDCRAVLKR